MAADVAAIPAHGLSCFCSSAAAEMALASATETTTVDVAAAANPKRTGKDFLPGFSLGFFLTFSADYAQYNWGVSKEKSLLMHSTYKIIFYLPLRIRRFLRQRSTKK